MRHPHTNIILSLFSIPLVLKCAAKKIENRFTNKNLTSKNVFELGFCIGKGDDPKIFNFEFWQICRLHSNVWTPGKLFLLFSVGFLHFYKILKLLFFSGKIVTTLGKNFSLQKSLLKNIFGR